MNLNEVVEKLIKEFNADTYRSKNKNGMEVKYENKKNTSCD